MPGARTPRTTAAVRAQVEEDGNRLERVSVMLEGAQKDLGLMRGSVGAGVGDLRRDVNRLLRDARRDLNKMRRALQRDLDRLQKDLTSPAVKSTHARRHSTSTSRTSRRTTASTH